MECAFGILKYNWWKLLHESSLSVHIMPNIVATCTLLHNMVLTDKDVDIELLIQHVAQEIGENFEDNDGMPTQQQRSGPPICLHGE